jgi:hypothetical protein
MFKVGDLVQWISTDYPYSHLEERIPMGKLFTVTRAGFANNDKLISVKDLSGKTLLGNYFAYRFQKIDPTALSELERTYHGI